MPIYEYYCNDCSQTFSALRPMSQSDSIIACSACESTQTQRVLSLFAFRTEGGNRASALPMSNGGGCACGGGGCGCAH